ncbi:MAG: DUF3108 domain-containing protein [Hydrogenophaga sp.]|uniref:DUF3108 domain-containing protein n=1 Tax=Hydrogenophaga sp. TaxID=1904254 RepID=UPI0016ADC89A|nr:DUF3108 domain-containing protein [Hydrogenophaga sp.]NIM42055.1 DUF3108 domain-containing protein [Hydrogenophaga sp.]NIN27354.1 DUF3108 domain-containing protein [Hydrogenophaga sp.]NIN32055.1 DUF3108 domain-containing protein [Hydrogenophaga sp.]NIN56210.1 DUF3108 domain-containing protein [Hydrogenophaga sp.]NIO52432.1 DUF3108 domain-containing protein [Hydrogenophaga sp.]
MLLAHLAVLVPVGASPLPAAPAAATAAVPEAVVTTADRVEPLDVTQVQWAAAERPPAPPAARRPTTMAPSPIEAPVLTAQAAQAPSPKSAAATATPAAAAPPSDPPPATELSYEVFGQAKGFDYRATGTLSWRREGANYQARMELAMPLLGKRVQTSEGSVGPDGLRPVRFADKRSSERAAHFEREARRIRFSNNAPEAEWLPGAQDRLSLFMQLAGLLRAQPRQAGDVLSFQVAGVGDAEVWQFEVGALETLRLPAGNIEARLLKRAPRKPHDSTVEVWLAPSLGHLPVRLRIAQPGGDVADQRLARLP